MKSLTVKLDDTVYQALRDLSALEGQPLTEFMRFHIDRIISAGMPRLEVMQRARSVLAE